MKICLQQFLSGKHSWGIVGQNIARAFLKKGHDVHMKSTNGYEFFPEDLKNNIVENLDAVYDAQISYTAPKNFPIYLSRGVRNRFGIWTYEWPLLPAGFTKYHQSVDKILAPSTFAKYCFVNSGVPDDKVMVVPHGINLQDYENKTKYSLKTKKKRKILVNIGQAHLRKAIPDMFKAYFEAFTDKDDVCLVAKIFIKKKIEHSFEVDPISIYNKIKSKYKNPAEVELITSYVPCMVELYNACDIVFTLSHCEGYYMPAAEALAVGKLNIAPRYGGQLDFLNDNNSLLVEGTIVRAPKEYQYWESNLYNTHFQSDIQDAVLKLRKAVFEYDELMNKFLPNIKNVINDYTWDKVAQQIESFIK